jgi:hypothetical protein
LATDGLRRKPKIKGWIKEEGDMERRDEEEEKGGRPKDELNRRPN